MAVTRATLERMAVPLNRGDFPAFVDAVGRLPAADRNILAVLGAGDLISHARSRNSLLREAAARRLQGWLLQFKEENIDETQLPVRSPCLYGSGPTPGHDRA